MAGYEVPVHADIPHQEVIFLDETDPISSPIIRQIVRAQRRYLLIVPGNVGKPGRCKSRQTNLGPSRATANRALALPLNAAPDRRECDKLPAYLPSHASVLLPRQQVVASTVR